MTRTLFKDLFDNHFDAVRNYIYYRSGDSELATDIAQETFMKIWEKRIDSSNSKNINGLLFKIAGDLFISSYRRQKVITNFKLNLTPAIEKQSPEDTFQFNELKSKYELALVKLPEKQRTVFLMSRIDNMKYHEIANATGISIKAVEKRMKYALAFFKTELNY
ncbi:MAG: sigma-70 family RNA polymerase sigma factor [Bacteroidetes bacterium]|nr:sigma-70 family RNA polymerase sigma factor [Bacteroidota bacterium]MBL6943584.1 sigma-70 family RNA polymerase sigma factor [Bacteroidales bacterium]